MTTIPASQIVQVNPSVLPAGGITLDIIALMLTNSTRVPIGAVQSFPDAESVGDYFGSASTEAALASVYFNGFTNASRTPGALLFAQYNADDAPAYLRGGDASGLTLAELQAISGTLSIVVDGFTHTAGALTLAAATSFSSAAGIIETAINNAAPAGAEFTASIGATFTGSISGTTLTVTSVAGGIISVGDTLSGTGGGGVTAGTEVMEQLTGTIGSTGTYRLSASQTVTSSSIDAASNVLRVTAISSGELAEGQVVDSTGTDATVLEQLTGTAGLAGTYLLSGDPQTVASEAMTADPAPVSVSYDSTSGAFVIESGIVGTVSAIDFATGTTAAALFLTEATGAVISLGADAAVPGVLMDALVEINSTFVTFMTTFNPDAEGETTVREAFAAWKTEQNERFCYVVWDTDVGPTQTVPDDGSLAQILEADNDSGTAVQWEVDDTAGATLCAFVCGAAASINFDEPNGRITFAFKAQAGLTAGVTDGTVAANLGGNPQQAGRGNGYNFYGAYGSANQDFTWFQRGFVTGDFAWLDSYINQIWLNNSLQSALLALMQNARSIPYTEAGNTMIAAALNDPIQAALLFGAFGPGTISSSQKAQVNQQAGANIADTLQGQGWFLQILPASATVRQGRASPPMRFWYLDRGAVQAISLSSVAVN